MEDCIHLGGHVAQSHVSSALGPGQRALQSGLAAVGVGIVERTRLSCLDLSNNCVDDQDVSILGGYVFGKLPNVRHLNLRDERISELNDAFCGDRKPLVENLHSVTGLQHLEISYWQREKTRADRIDRARALAQCLRPMTQLTCLQLQDGSLNGDDLEVIGPVLGCLSALQVLHTYSMSRSAVSRCQSTLVIHLTLHSAAQPGLFKRVDGLYRLCRPGEVHSGTPPGAEALGSGLHVCHLQRLQTAS